MAMHISTSHPYSVAEGERKKEEGRMKGMRMNLHYCPGRHERREKRMILLSFFPTG